MEADYRRIPQMGVLLERPETARMTAAFGRQRTEDALRGQAALLRKEIAAGTAPEPPYDSLLLQRASKWLADWERPSLQSVVNATGVTLHTNLGRAPLADAAVKAMTDAAGFCNLEYDLEKGERSARNDHVEGLLVSLLQKDAPGWEIGAIAVNNNAAALALLSMTWGGEGVYLSRGEMVEIGDGFRVGEIISASGGRLVEVGSTNRTRTADYVQAFSDGKRDPSGRLCGMILKVHTSNYRIVGFAGSPSIAELSALPDRPLVAADLGGGAILEEAAYPFEGEISVGHALRDGADYVCFSGDKLMGGPQCGILVGRKEGIAALRAHPLYRAFRPCKLTLAALEATLRLYLNPERAKREIPVLRILLSKQDRLLERADAFRRLCVGQDREENSPCEFKVVETRRPIGGGCAPGEELPGAALSVRPRRGDPVMLWEQLRRSEPPMVGRITEGHLLLDVSTMDDKIMKKAAKNLCHAIEIAWGRDAMARHEKDEPQNREGMDHETLDFGNSGPCGSWEDRPC